MHEDELAALVVVRVGVLIRHPAMRGPAGVADADAAMHRRLANDPCQLRNAAHRFANLDAMTVECRHPGGIVSTVLQPAQAVQKNGHRLSLANVSNNSAHISLGS